MAEKVRREAEAEATKPVVRVCLFFVCQHNGRGTHVSNNALCSTCQMQSWGRCRWRLRTCCFRYALRHSLQFVSIRLTRVSTQQDETVLRALKRMSGKPAAGAGRGRGAATPGRATAASASHMDPAQRAAFERLTELSSTLMAFGEYDVYTFTKEGFLRSARALCAPVPATAAPASARGAATSMDMFADDDDVKPPPAKRQATAEARVTAGNAPASSPPDFSSWSVAQVRRFLDVRGQTAAATGAVEKGDLIALARDTASTAGLQIPAGYAWDAASGLYMSAESGLSYDIATCAFGDSSGQWYLWDATTNKFVPWTTGSL
jgi:OCRE domain